MEWEATKDTLHLWLQIVGKIRMTYMPPRNHWWHVPLYLDVHGLTTRRIPAHDELTFQMAFDFIDHRLIVDTNHGRREKIDLYDGLSVAEFDHALHDALNRLEVDATIHESPFGVEMTTPFPADHEHASYDRDLVERFWRLLEWTESLFDEFSGWYCGKTSPVHLYWHSLDLAFARYNGARAPAQPDADPVTQEAYSHEVIAFGFWTGDRNIPEPSYYSYTSPEPSGLRERELLPRAARWSGTDEASMALLPLQAVRTASDPRTTLLAFLESSYEAGAIAAGWNRESLASSWCPSPVERNELLLQAQRDSG